MGLASAFAYLCSNATPGRISTEDFGGLYYQARCAAEHKDAYDPQTVLREFEADGEKLPASPPKIARSFRLIITTAVYPPTVLLLIDPLARLPWAFAVGIWLGAVAALLVLAALLVWDLAADAPAVAGCMASFLVLNCALLLLGGNAAGMVIPLCVIGAWCLLKERLVPGGVLALALALVVKPQVAGFVWLYFLLAGGRSRKRALQTLAVVGVLAAGSAIWIAPMSPHWPGELLRDVSIHQARGNTQDPGPTGTSEGMMVPHISLQRAVSIFRNDPGFYNPVSYAIGGGLMLIWCVAVVRKRATREGSLLALAAVSALTLLPVYHLAFDARLLLLTIPACAMLWGGKGPQRWVALVLTSAAIVATSDMAGIFAVIVTHGVPVSTATLMGKLADLLLEPAPVVLLATACFYLWVYIRYQPEEDRAREAVALEARAAAS
jgi:hypothetical protein